MKKLFLALVLTMISLPAFAVTQWTVNVPTNAADLKSNFPAENLAQQTILQTLLQNYRQGYTLSYNNSTTVSIGSGEVSVWNGSGSLFLQNAAAQTATTAQLDTGVSFNPSTTYYVYAGATSGTAASSTISISLNSSTPGNLTWYKRLGSFTTDASSNVAAVLNDNNNNQFGAMQTKSASVVYQAQTDGIVNAWGATSASYAQVIGYTDSSSSPTTNVAYAAHGTAGALSVSFSVKKGDYWSAYLPGCSSSNVYFRPVGN